VQLKTINNTKCEEKVNENNDEERVVITNMEICAEKLPTGGTCSVCYKAISTIAIRIYYKF